MFFGHGKRYEARYRSPPVPNPSYGWRPGFCQAIPRVLTVRRSAGTPFGAPERRICMPVTMQLSIIILTTWKSRSPHATTSLPFPRCSVRWILPPRNDDTSSKPHHSAPRTVRPRAGSRSLILGESKLSDAQIRFCGSTNARPTTPRDGCDGRKANLHAARTFYFLTPVTR